MTREQLDRGVRAACEVSEYSKIWISSSIMWILIDKWYKKDIFRAWILNSIHKKKPGQYAETRD